MNENILWFLIFPLIGILSLILQFAFFAILGKAGEVKSFTVAHLCAGASIIYFFYELLIGGEPLSAVFFIGMAPQIYAYAIGCRYKEDSEFAKKITPFLDALFGRFIKLDRHQIKKRQQLIAVSGAIFGLLIGCLVFSDPLKIFACALVGCVVGLMAFTYYVFLAGSSHGL